MQQTLTQQDMKLFKHALSGNHILMNILKFVFAGSVIAWFLFLIIMLRSDLKEGISIVSDVSLLIIFAAMTIVFVLVVHFITKRQNEIYLALQNGDYDITLTTILQKDFRYQGSGKNEFRIDFYTAHNVPGEISPISNKQYRHAKTGDSIKVIHLPQFSVTYGIVEVSYL